MNWLVVLPFFFCISPAPASGSELRESIRLPNRAGRPVPALLVFGGFESAGKVLSLLHPSIPVALASFDYPFHASRQLSFPASLRDLPEAKQVFPKTVAGIHALVDRLSRMPEIDPARMIVVGASFGAPFALAAAAEDPRISGVVIAHGFGRLTDTAEAVVLRSWLPRYGFWARPAAWLLSRVLGLYLELPEPESFAVRLRQRALMVSAEADSFIPRESTESLADALARSPAARAGEGGFERMRMPGDHLMPGSDALIAQIVARIEAWLANWPAGDPSHGK